jgi:hypothetical protein
MKAFTLMPIGAALLTLGLFSAVPSPASARDKDSGTQGLSIIRVSEDDRDNDRTGYKDDESDSDSGYLGVQVQRISAALRRAKGLPESTEGTLVSSVEDQSPADQAGIKRGDIILQVNRQDTSDPGDLVRVVRGLEPGRRVQVQIWRDGVTRTLTLRVGSRPEGSEMRVPPPPSWNPGDDRETRDMPDGSRMQILRRNRADLERQLQDLKAQVARLEREIHEMQAQMNRRDHDDRNDRDRDRDNNEDD